MGDLLCEREGGAALLRLNRPAARNAVNDEIMSALAEEVDRLAGDPDLRAVLLTGDLGFSNPIRFPLGRHCGIVIARFPNELSTAEVNRHLLNQLTTVTDEEYSGHVIVVEVGRIRIRRA